MTHTLQDTATAGREGDGTDAGAAPHFAARPDGPFALESANEYFGGWPAFHADPAVVALAFPVEGWRNAAAVLLRQPEAGMVTGEVYGAGADAARAWQQAQAVVSLDAAAATWPVVGGRDPVIGRLQQRYGPLRPVLFHSPYEAAAAFIIGHRISIQQGRALRQALAQAVGTPISVGAATLHAFPQPQVLRDLAAFPGLSAEKMRRLHAVAGAALDGLLDRATLRALPVAQALAELRTLPGVGEFFAQGILLRGAGLLDEVSDDVVTKEAVQRAYGLAAAPDHEAVLALAEAWRPFRMWATVLLHVWLRREAGGPHRPPGGSPARAATRKAPTA